MWGFDYQCKNCFPISISNHRTLTFGHTELCSIFQKYFPLCSFFEILFVSFFLWGMKSYLDLAWNATMDFEVCSDVWEFGKHIIWRNPELLTYCISCWLAGKITNLLKHSTFASGKSNTVSSFSKYLQFLLELEDNPCLILPFIIINSIFMSSILTTSIIFFSF